MRRIRVQNPLVDKTYKTFLGADYTAGATSATVKSVTSFVANDLLVFGEPTEEFSELKKLSSTSGNTTFTLASTLNFDHHQESPVYKVVWNFISIEADYGSGFSQISLSPIQWDSKTNETIYFDSNGTDTTNYRFRFYNDVTALYSEYSSSLTGAEPARNSVGYMIRNVRRIGQDPLRKIVSDDEIIRFFNRGQEIIYSTNPKWWFLLVDSYQAGTGLAATSNTSVYTLAGFSNFGHLSTIRYRYTQGNVDILYQLKRIGDAEFDARFRNLNKAKVDFVRFYRQLPPDSNSNVGYFQIDPKPQNNGVGIFYPNYYQKMTDLTSVASTTQIPFPSILEDYAVSQILRIKGETQKADLYENYFMGPPDRAKTIEKMSGIALLKQMDETNKMSQGQPSQLIKFRGQKAIPSLFGETLTASPDYLRENYFDSRTGG